jgi:hypothetical protein
MDVVEWMTAVLLVRPMVIEIKKLVALGRSIWSTGKSRWANRSRTEPRRGQREDG